MMSELSVFFTPSVAVCACHQLNQISDMHINTVC